MMGREGRVMLTNISVFRGGRASGGRRLTVFGEPGADGTASEFSAKRARNPWESRQSPEGQFFMTFRGRDERAACPVGKPWDRQPVSGKLRRKLGVSPGLRRIAAPKAVKHPVRLWLTWHCPMMRS